MQFPIHVSLQLQLTIVRVKFTIGCCKEALLQRLWCSDAAGGAVVPGNVQHCRRGWQPDAEPDAEPDLEPDAEPHARGR